PNGAGKTTFLRLLAGLLERDRGELLFDGVSFDRLDRRQLARRIAYVPQVRPARIPLTVQQVVEQGRYPHLSRRRMAPGPKDFEAVRWALERVGLDSLRHRPLDQLSGGERQAVFIAAALAQEARILILDEPTTHLDPKHQAQVTRILLGLKRETETTVISASHELHFAAAVADRIVAIKGGRTLCEGEPGLLLTPPRLLEVFETPFSAAPGTGVPWPDLGAGE
ncbi:MAG: ABC transporter ATP-binding protein, partial [Acidobacteria bacterium]|nr:ABC transporter ATP-binding protein [Acidobacteriota bacterium]